MCIPNTRHLFSSAIGLKGYLPYTKIVIILSSCCAAEIASAMPPSNQSMMSENGSERVELLKLLQKWLWINTRLVNNGEYFSGLCIYKYHTHLIRLIAVNWWGIHIISIIVFDIYVLTCSLICRVYWTPVGRIKSSKLVTAKIILHVNKKKTGMNNNFLLAVA